jgi:hypothetical protein
MPINFHTDEVVMIGPMPNHEGFQCLVCQKISELIHVDLFPIERRDIPASVAEFVPNELVITYRLCSRCRARAWKIQWKIRLLILERLNSAVGRGRL